MRTPKTLKALLLSALAATATVLPTASAAQVYFENDSGASGVVDVYVDGQLVFDDVFASSTMMFPREITGGQHEVVVTPFYLAPGQGDLLRSAVDVPQDGTSTLTLANDSDTNVLALDLSDGHAD